MSKDNIVSNTRPNDEESSFILEKNNLLSKEPQMTEERQKEVLCGASGRREAVNQDNDGVAYPTISSEAKILSHDVKELGEVGDCSTSSGVGPPSKNIHTSTEPKESVQLLKTTKSDLDDEVTDKDSDKPMTGSSYSTREAWQRLEDELTQFLSLDTEIQDRSNTCLVAGAYEIDDTLPLDSSSDLTSDISFLPTRKSSLSQRLLNSAPKNNDGMESETNDGEDGELPAKGRH